MSTVDQSSAPARTGWRSPLVVVICGCIIATLAFGPRSTFGFFMQPMSKEFEWGRDVFAFALAIQNLLWGIGQPFAGAIADKFGTVRVIAIGGLMYAAGLVLMRYADTPLALNATVGVLIGFGLAGCSFSLVVSAFAKVVPESWRGIALGAGTAAGSFGQFLFAPFGVAMLDNFGWQTSLLVFAALTLLILPLSLALTTPAQTGAIAAPTPAEQQSIKQALAEAFGHRSYVLLVLGFFTCGFHVAFITVHLPAYLIDRGLDATTGGWVIGVIGLFNVIGAFGVGWLAVYVPKRYILSAIYAIRALSVVLFIAFPITPATALAFAVVTGLTWLSTVPPTSGLVAVMFGTRWLGTLFGFAFFSHQVGSFLGVWLGGLAFEATGSYNFVWWLAVILAVASALINLPIVEKPVMRAAAQAA